MLPRRLLLTALLIPLSAVAQTHWVGTWGTSPAPLLQTEREVATAKLEFNNQTLREIVHVSVGGRNVRVRLTNAYGRGTAEIGAVHIALRESGSAIVPQSDRPLTFGGRPVAMIPPDAELLSDPVALDIPPASDLVISLYLPKRMNGAGIHYGAYQTSYVGPADLTAAKSIPDALTFTSWVFLKAVEVEAPANAYTLVTFGDSITDGTASGADANARWPDVISGRLRAAQKQVGIVNAGIGGNRLLHDPPPNIRFGVNALARFDRDALAVPGVKCIVVLEGINDLGHPGASVGEDEAVSAEDIIGAYKQLIARAHEHGIRIIGATLTPFDGTGRGYFTPAKEVKRKAVNEWIRTSKGFDAVIDFDQAVRDPANPDHMAAAYDSGDHLHPKAPGYKAMAESIDLSIFDRP